MLGLFQSRISRGAVAAIHGWREQFTEERDVRLRERSLELRKEAAAREQSENFQPAAIALMSEAKSRDNARRAEALYRPKGPRTC